MSSFVFLPTEDNFDALLSEHPLGRRHKPELVSLLSVAQSRVFFLLNLPIYPTTSLSHFSIFFDGYKIAWKQIYTFNFKKIMCKLSSFYRARWSLTKVARLLLHFTRSVYKNRKAWRERISWFPSWICSHLNQECRDKLCTNQFNWNTWVELYWIW